VLQPLAHSISLYPIVLSA